MLNISIFSQYLNRLIANYNLPAQVVHDMYIFNEQVLRPIKLNCRMMNFLHHIDHHWTSNICRNTSAREISAGIYENLLVQYFIGMRLK